MLVLAEDSGVGSIIGWSLVLIAFIVIGFYTILWLRRWMKDDDPAPTGIGFTLGDLRDLHRRGEMTDEEFEKARAMIVAGTQSAAAKIKPASADARDSAEAIRARVEARRNAQPPPPSDKPRS